MRLEKDEEKCLEFDKTMEACEKTVKESSVSLDFSHTDSGADLQTSESNE